MQLCPGLARRTGPKNTRISLRLCSRSLARALTVEGSGPLRCSPHVETFFSRAATVSNVRIGDSHAAASIIMTLA